MIDDSPTIDNSEYLIWKMQKMIIINMVVIKDEKTVIFDRKCVSFLDINYCIKMLKEDYGFTDRNTSHPYYQLVKNQGDFTIMIRVYKPDIDVSFDSLLLKAQIEMEEQR